MTETESTVIELFRARITDLTIVSDYKIGSADEASAVAEQMKSIHQLGKDIDAAKRAELAPIADAEKAIREKWRAVESMASGLKTTANACLSDWKVREFRRIAEERAKAEREAALARAKAEEEARRAREAAAAKAAELEAAGKAEKAEAVRHAAEQKAIAAEVAASLSVVAVVEEQKLAGVRTTETWTPVVEDQRKALASLLADEFVDLDELVAWKQSGLNRMAAQYKDQLAKKYPGIVAKKSVKTSATGR